MQAAELLKNARIRVSPESFHLISVDLDGWLKLLENPELSPRMTAPFMIFRDDHEVTLLLDETDFGTIRGALGDARTEGNFRLLTFDIELGFEIVGFLAEITRILAAAGIPIIALSAFSRDHLLIKQKDLSAALKALSGYVDEIC